VCTSKAVSAGALVLTRVLVSALVLEPALRLKSRLLRPPFKWFCYFLVTGGGSTSAAATMARRMGSAEPKGRCVRAR
jgi:hypothetical protein